MHQLLSITVILLLTPVGSFAGDHRAYESVLTVTNGGRWGSWGQREMCPDGFYAAGFSLKVEHPIDGDDTALNGIRLRCVNTPSGRTDSSSYATVKSETGSWGTWTDTKWCKSGMLMSFNLLVERYQGNGDDTAANNIKFQCSENTEIIGDGTSWGQWGGWSRWCTGKGICGIETKIEKPQGSGDDTALNDVKFYCCS